MTQSIDIIIGAAGTGKTEHIKTLQSSLIEQGRPHLVVTPTNRAAKVLRSRGIMATTIHKGLYRCKPTGETTTVLRPVIDNATNMPRVVNGETVYHEFEQPVYEFKFDVAHLRDHTIIIDEASMVQSQVWKDIFDNFQGNLVVVGDPNQLLPVEQEESIVPEYFRYFNQLAQHATKDLGGDENNRRLDPNTSGIHTAIRHISDKRNHQGDFPELHGQAGYFYYDMRKNTVLDAGVRAILYQADAIVCWTNDEREFLNTLIRQNICSKNNTMFTPYPVVGDRIIADSSYDIENEQGDIERIITKGDDLVIQQVSEVDAKNNIMWIKFAGIAEPIAISVAHIGGGRVPREIRCLRWIYGYAITCHKAQGSGWNTVVVVDSYSRPDDARRWRYTAATRARKNLVVLKSGIGFNRRSLV